MGARIMVVEDERIVALDLKGGLESLGYDVVGIAARGAEAVERATALRPDLVLMDIHLEGAMDGTEAARLIHDDLHLPVVFLTAFAAEKTLARAEASVPYGYLLKPFELRELEATVRMALARRKVEMEVERSEERLRMALDAAGLGVMEWSSEKTAGNDDKYQIGKSIERVLGSAPQLIADGRERFLERIHEEDRPRLRAALESCDAVSTIARMNFADGSMGWVEIHVQMHPGEDEQSGRVIGVIRDITQRHLHEEQLRQASVVFQSTAEGIVVTDAQRRIISVNPAFTMLTGYNAEHALGREPESFLHARRRSDPGYLHLDNQASWQGEIACQRSNGEIFPSWQHVSAVKDPQGNITHYVITFSDISSIRKAEAQINHMAYHDALTGLGNRHQLDELLDGELDRHRREGHRFALIFMDLDGFKLINDTLGHTCGDQLLQIISGRIRDSIRRSDVAIRLGGDEFVVFVPEIKRVEDCALLADKLLQRVRAPVELPHETVSVSGSLGIAVFPDDASTRQGLIKAADSAMYEAKSRGRNRFAFYSPDMAERTRERMLIEQGLVRAIEDKRLVLHYQPVVNLTSREMIGMEVLVRWDHPELGIVPPERFIPVAEESGLIDGIGTWVMETACRQAAEWIAQHGMSLKLSVNVSVREMASETFVERITSIIDATGIPPEILEIEITESTLQSIEYSQGLLYRLRNLGISIAIDDFGTGFSSLGLLRHLPIDRIKIDRSFVRDLPEDTNDTAITRAIISMAQSMGIAVTAEGIENSRQHIFLRDLGCQHGQGYLFCKPMPHDEFAALLSGDPSSCASS